jgi:hypothetical protein
MRGTFASGTGLPVCGVCVTPDVALDFDAEDRLGGSEMLGREGVEVVAETKTDVLTVLPTPTAAGPEGDDERP